MQHGHRNGVFFVFRSTVHHGARALFSASRSNSLELTLLFCLLNYLLSVFRDYSRSLNVPIYALTRERER